MLKPEGVALIHTIARMGRPAPIGAWIRKYVFPGAYLPSISQLAGALEEQHLWLTDVENLRIHYAKTLCCWYERFNRNRDKIAGIYDKRFCRMWEMYLLGCEMVFRVQDITVLQLQITRQIDALPITRNYMVEAEQALALSDVGVGSSSMRRRESFEKGDNRLDGSVFRCD